MTLLCRKSLLWVGDATRGNLKPLDRFDLHDLVVQRRTDEAHCIVARQHSRFGARGRDDEVDGHGIHRQITGSTSGWMQREQRCSGGDPLE